jgi:Protochlamydia outer membrane protein
MLPFFLKCGLCLLPFFPLTSGLSTLCNLSLQAEGTFGWRQDCVNWCMAGHTEEDTELFSQVSWKDLKMMQAGARIKFCGLGSFYARAYGDCAKIYQGMKLDSNLWSRETMKEFCPSVHHAGKGETYDLSFGLGIPTVRLCGFLVVPMVGYAYMQQHLQMFNNQPMVFKEHPELEGFKNKSHNRWKGPWTGVDLSICLGNLTLEGEWEYHWTHFFGKGDWNLRDSFSNDLYDQANGRGVRTNVRLLYNIFSFLSIGLGVDFWDFHAKNGKSEVALPLHLLNSDGDIVQTYSKWFELGFKQIRWRSARVNGVISFCF